MKAAALRITALLIIAGTLAYAFRDRLYFWLQPIPRPPSSQLGLTLADLPPGALTEVARDLWIPWEIAFLPDGDLLVSERPGTLVRIGNGRRSYAVPGVRHVGEGGLMGVALHPEFDRNRWIYLALTGDGPAGPENRVERYRLDDDSLAERTIILDRIPGARFHDGGRIAFGPDGYLYVTTGDATDTERAQDTSSLAGKILRVSDTGTAPADNPFGNTVYSYGHRNAQGLAWDENNRLWSTEHGPSGIGTGFDELNLIDRGANYGWPVTQGDQAAPGMVPPVLHSGASYTWAPTGVAFWNGSLFFGGLLGEALYQARLQGSVVSDLRVHFHRELGRIRVVRLGPDGMLYLATSNRDGRGSPREGDDRILRLDPSVNPSDPRPLSLHQDAPAFLEAVNATAAVTGFAPRLVEKDYFCTALLQHLAPVGGALFFRGGTCLAKVHAGFYRLSEDLDFVIPTPVAASRGDRSRRAHVLTGLLAAIDEKLPDVQVRRALEGANNSTQYTAVLSYKSRLRNAEETINFEIGLREPLVTAPVHGEVKTLLIDPVSGVEQVPRLIVPCLSREEAMAEKLRAALCRREAAIRDFFDIDHVVRRLLVRLDDPNLLELVRQKLAVPGTGSPDTSRDRLYTLRAQLDAELRPALRPVDFDNFDLDATFEAVAAVAAAMR